jgi:TonB-dependent starch-binding outer membrane protein SusC
MDEAFCLLLRKIRLVMRISSALILMTCLHASAAGFGQKITLKEKSAPIEKVFRLIKSQTDYEFLFNSNTLKNAKPVTVEVNNTPIDEVLKLCFDRQPFSFKIINQTIVVTELMSSTAPTPINSSSLTTPPISGIVKGPDGKPLAGVNIIVKGTKKGTVSRADGSFMIDANAGDVLVISNIGYTSKEMVVEQNTTLNVNLIIANAELEEVVINKGYYSTAKTLNTGSVGTLKADDIVKQPVNDFTMALQGRIAGLNVVQGRNVPGAALTVTLRGRNSIANGNEPLYIVDGVPYPSTTMSQITNSTIGNRINPLNAIRPDNIESITVLKDADATAIYGSRGANGVIIISTKKGKAGTTKADFNVYTATSEAMKFLNIMNTGQYLAMRREALENDNATPQPTDYDVNGTWSETSYTDWQQLLIGGNAETVDAKASVSGGTERTQYLFNTGYRRETTIFPGDFSSNIGTAHLNLNHRSENDKFKVGLSTTYTYTNYRIPVADYNSLIYMAPNAPTIYDEKGNLNWQDGTFQNPFANLLQRSQSITDNLINNVALSYQLPANFELNLNAAYNIVKLDESNFTPATFYMPGTRPDLTTARDYLRANNQIRTWNVEPQLYYNKHFGKHHIHALLAATLQATDQNSLFINASGYASDALIENPAFATTKINGANFSQYRYNAMFARIGYNYDGKYVLNLTGRRDGSSRFGPANRYGNFGAIGAAWIFSNEGYIANNLPFLSLGKIRGSIGRTGNDQMPNYQYLSTYTSDGTAYSGNNGLLPNRLTNPYFGWETIDKMELAVEFGFFKDRLHANVNLFRNRTKNQLVGNPLPPATGFTTVNANLPAVIQNKGLEIEIMSDNIRTTAFFWNSSFNLTIPRNKLLSFSNLPAHPFASRYIIGMPLDISYLWQYTGLDPNTGVYTFADINKDDQYTLREDARPVFVGHKFYGGINNSISHKGFTLDFFFQFVRQNGRRYISRLLPGAFVPEGLNQPVLLLNHWTKPGDDATFQKYNQDFSVLDANFMFEESNARIVDASFIRLKNVMIAYSLPDVWIKRISMQQIRLYVQAQNLLTITKFKQADPESGTGISPLRTVAAGIQFSF